MGGQMITSEIQMTINIEAILLGAFVAKGGLVQFRATPILLF